MAKKDTPQQNLLKLGAVVGFPKLNKIATAMINNGIDSEFEKYEKMNEVDVESLYNFDDMYEIEDEVEIEDTNIRPLFKNK